MTRQPVLNLGVIGLGPDWESRYGPSIAKLASRIRIMAVYDDTVARAEEVAHGVHAQPARGVRSFFGSGRRSAVLILRLGWHGGWLLETACRAAVPLFIGEHVLRNPAARRCLEELIPVAREVIVPEQPVRYHASMLRLRELMATRIGPAQQIHVNLPASQAALGEAVTLPDLLSWCCVAFGLRPDQAAEASTGFSGPQPDAACLMLPSRNRRSVALTVQAHDPASVSSEAHSGSSPPFCSIVCVDGRADLISPREIHWQAGEGIVTERLEGDRSATDVMLDLFARRAAGGLIPVADLADIHHGELLAERLLA